MTDNHIHIGQFESVYYDPFKVADIVMLSSVDGFSFSSTSSCIKNIKYSEVEKEIKNFLSATPYSDKIIKPFLWYIPHYHSQNISIESVFNEIPYKGLKIHPYMHNWEFANNQHMDVLHKLFDYALQNDLPILIHTGYSDNDCANRFESFINEYSKVKCILAHCRPLDITISMLKKYCNTYCDTAFVSKTDIKKIIDLGFGDRVIFGTDFPITHYFKTKIIQPKKKVTMKEQYSEDIYGWDEIFNQN